ncbi:hypothetical protein [Catellatospora vulcania]|nr:hypothetical protein [Catellatospora vulcania]
MSERSERTMSQLSHAADERSEEKAWRGERTMSQVSHAADERSEEKA